MTTRLLRISMFSSAYAPLLVIWGIRYSDISIWIPIALGAIAVTFVAGVWLFIRSVRRLIKPTAKTVVDVNSRANEMLGYVVPYILPFMRLDVTNWKVAVPLVVLFVMLAVVYVRLNMIHVNPLLSLAGFHLYEIQLDGGDRATLLTRRRYVKPRSTIQVHVVDNLLFLEEVGK